jgi:mannose-6-phosphate isomerase
MTDVLYPLRFKPVYKDYLWGGDRIIRAYNRNEPPGVYAESWEVTDRPEGMSVVANGLLAGVSLHELIAKYGSDLLGTRVPQNHFPLLIKLIDSRQCLSVQVHPSDETAAQYGGEAKTEMWYALDADPEAQVYAGLKPGVDSEAFRRAIDDNSFGEVLQTVPMEKGDAVYIPGGRVHAIDAGCLLLEVQQNSNTTYRIYDWGRTGADGQPRPLHIDQALQVIQWDDRENPKVAPVPVEMSGANPSIEILTSPYFRLDKRVLKAAWPVPAMPETFQVLFVAEGTCRISWNGGEETLEAGSNCMIPAVLDGYILEPELPETQVLAITIPK